MNIFKIGFTDGDSFTTGFNGSLEDAKAYYLGHPFNLGTESDNMKICNSVEQLSPLNPMCKDCRQLYNGCGGTYEKVWTGCVYREV